MSNNVTLSGRIAFIHEPEIFMLNGERVQYTNARLQYKDDNDNNFCVLTFWGDKQSILQEVKEGDRVDLEVWVHSKESNKNRGTYYHKLDCIRLIAKY